MLRLGAEAGCYVIAVVCTNAAMLSTPSHTHHHSTLLLHSILYIKDTRLAYFDQLDPPTKVFLDQSQASLGARAPITPRLAERPAAPREATLHKMFHREYRAQAAASDSVRPRVRWVRWLSG